MTDIPGSPLIGGATCGSGHCWINWIIVRWTSDCLTIFAPHYLDLGVDPEALHRTVAISSGSLDSLPQGGYVVTTIRSIAGETHKDAYPAFGALSVVVPILGAAVAVILFSIGL